MIRTLLLAGTAAATATALVLAAPLGAEDTAPAARPTMSFGTWGVDTSQIDPSIDPGDDFFAYVNNRWLAANPIPDELSRYGASTFLDDKSKADVKLVIEDLLTRSHAPGTKEQRIVDAYRAYLDVDAINARGMAPVYPFLTRIYTAGSLADLISLSTQPGIPSPITPGVTIDSKAPDTHISSIGFDGMGMGDRDYYLGTDDKSRTIQAAYRKYLAFVLGKAGYDDAATAADAVYAFEFKVAELEWARTALRNRDLTYHKLSRKELVAMAGGFPLDAMLDQAGYAGVDTFVTNQIPPSAERAKELGLTPAQLAEIGGGLPAMFQLLQSTPIATLKAWMAARLITNHAEVLPEDVDQAHFDFFRKTMFGIPEQDQRWKRAITNIEGQMGEMLGQAYVERNFPPSSKAAMDDLVANLRLAMGENLKELEWMSDDTRVQAQAKLASFTPKIGYPDEFETYAGLDVSASDPVGNQIAAGAWARKDNRAKLGQPIDRKEWGMLPQTVNAYYSPLLNEIVFPAAILQQPFFGLTADPAVNYGGIGAVIGHEIGHGYDDQGSKYDATGMLRNWWTAEDRAKFVALTDRLVAQYDAFCPLDEGKTCVNGRLSLGENLGDLGGLSMAYRAYRMSLKGKEAPVIDGLTGDQRFFLAFAQIWRAQNREARLRDRLKTGPHSPEMYRVNGIVRNMDAWYKAFNITPDDDLYLPPEQRVKVW